MTYPSQSNITKSVRNPSFQRRLILLKGPPHSGPTDLQPLPLIVWRSLWSTGPPRRVPVQLPLGPSLYADQKRWSQRRSFHGSPEYRIPNLDAGILSSGVAGYIPAPNSISPPVSCKCTDSIWLFDFVPVGRVMYVHTFLLLSSESRRNHWI